MFMKIMTSNIWGDYFCNPTTVRDKKLYSVYKKYAPDIIGFQEVTEGWYKSDLFKDLSLEYYFVGTEIINSTNFVPIAVKKNISLLAKGFEYFENTPDESKAVTWAVLRSHRLVFAVCNVHFWWMRGTEPAETKRAKGVLDLTPKDHCQIRADNAIQLSKLMQNISKRFACPVFAFGDMNSTVTESVFHIYRKNGIKHLFDLAEQKDITCSMHGNPLLGNDGQFHGAQATEEYVSSLRENLCLPKLDDNAGYLTSIDHIVALGDGFKVSGYRVVTDQSALDATDHSPVYADIEL